MAKPNVDRTLRQARLLEGKGSFAEARSLYNEILAAFPQNARARQALETLRTRSLAANAAQNPPPDQLSAVWDLYKSGQLAAASGRAADLIKTFPNSFLLWHILGLSHLGLKNWDAAAAGFARATALDANQPEPHYKLGRALMEQGKADDAIAPYRAALALKPDYVEAQYSLANALSRLGRSDDAVAAYEKTIALRPEHADACNNLGIELIGLGRPDEAITAYQRALSIRPDYAEAHNNLGGAFAELGRTDEAIAAYRNALAVRADYAECYGNLALVHRWEADDRLIGRLEELHAASKSDGDRRHLSFALFKAYDKTGNYEAAFDHLRIGNELRRQENRWDISIEDAIFRKIKQNDETIAQSVLQPSGSSDATPIFVVGMPRSGTTLVEQILSSNPTIYGAGELKLVMRHGGNIAAGSMPANAESLEAFRDNYLSGAAALCAGHDHFVDKMPQNFRFLGLIARSIPEAIIVHVIRDPAATCWSNYETSFSDRGLEYACSVDGVADYYRLYFDMMTFWTEKLGPRIHHLDYDALTENPDIEIRQFIDGIGLAWDDRYLSPEQNTRVVRTASAGQVRQPIYKGSSDRWRRYEPFLKGAFDTLPRFEFGKQA